MNRAQPSHRIDHQNLPVFLILGKGVHALFLEASYESTVNIRDFGILSAALVELARHSTYQGDLQMTIAGISSNALNFGLPLAPTGKTSSSTSALAFGDNLTISQVRDKVDLLARTGQLTTDQQRALIAAGLQDLNAEDKTYQPAAQNEGYVRTNTTPINLQNTLHSIAAFDSSHGELALAATYSGLANRLEQDNLVAVFNTIT